MVVRVKLNKVHGTVVEDGQRDRVVDTYGSRLIESWEQRRDRVVVSCGSSVL